ncbi:MAG: membrane protein insertion efficiency factor YidD [Gemmatimonadales bacterium]|nr:MAG: membrane protein insertion efficiency factor YidD [Gemmatimonadales bacterium]
MILGLIRFYQKGISPLSGPKCRFIPTCSCYAHEAVSRYGVLRGGWLFVRRFARCHPFGGHGVDPVPELDGDMKKDRSDGAAEPDSPKAVV